MKTPNIVSLGFFALLSLNASAQEVLIKPQWAPAVKSLPYQPFEMKDERTGKLLKPDDIVTLGDGRKVKAKVYYQNLNDSEKYLTGRGYTLRSKNSNFGVVAAVPSTENLKAEQMKQVQGLMAPELSSARPVLVSGPKTGGPLLPPGHPVPIDNTAPKTGGPLLPPGHSVPIDSTTPGTVTEACSETNPGAKGSRTFNPIFGARGTAQLNTLLSGSYEAKCSGITGTAAVNIVGTLLNNDLRIAEARLVGRASKDGNASIDTDVFIAGKKVFDLDQSQSAQLDIARTFSQSVQTSFRARGFAGPIPISFTLGATGSANLIFSFNAKLSTASAKVTPQIKANSFAEGAADIFVARAGIGASLVIVDLNSPVTFTASLSTVTGRHIVSGSCEANSSLRALNGRIFLFGELNLIFVRPRFEADLAKFSGFQVNGPAFTLSSSADLTLSSIVSLPGITPTVLKMKREDLL